MHEDNAASRERRIVKAMEQLICNSHPPLDLFAHTVMLCQHPGDKAERGSVHIPVPLGNGTLMKYEEQYFCLTAGHVLKELRGAHPTECPVVAKVRNNGKTQYIQPPMLDLKHAKHDGLYNTGPNGPDIAVIPIDPERAKAFERHAKTGIVFKNWPTVLTTTDEMYTTCAIQMACGSWKQANEWISERTGGPAFIEQAIQIGTGVTFNKEHDVFRHFFGGESTHHRAGALNSIQPDQKLNPKEELPDFNPDSHKAGLGGLSGAGIWTVLARPEDSPTEIVATQLTGMIFYAQRSEVGGRVIAEVLAHGTKKISEILDHASGTDISRRKQSRGVTVRR